MIDVLHPIKWLKLKLLEYLDYDQDWENDYRDALAPVAETVRVRPRWGQADPAFDYLFQTEETRLMPRLQADGTVVDREETTVTFKRARVANQDTEEVPEFAWVKQVLAEMDVEFRSRLMADPIDDTDPVYRRRRRLNVQRASREWLRFLETPLPDWDDDWEAYISSGVSSSIVQRALHASDRGAADTLTIERVRI